MPSEAAPHRLLAWVPVLAVCLALPGCGEDPCGGARPTADRCRIGLFRADCGGTGEPTFACGGGSCLWFATGCVAEEFEVSDCPETNRCCHGSPGHTWPFADDWTRADRLGDVTEDIAAYGSTPVTSDRPAPITVVIDPTVAVTSPSRVACTGAAIRDFCRATGFAPTDTGDGGVTLSMMSTALSPEVVMLEIVHVDEDTLGARAFIRRTTEGPGLPYCESAQTPHLTFTGTLTLSSSDLGDPSALHGRADLVLDGDTVTIGF